MPKMPSLIFMLHLNIRKRRVAARAPIGNAGPLINQSFFIKAHKDLADRAGTAFIHRETLALPIAGRTQRTQLRHNAIAKLFLPLPDPFQKLLPAKIIAAFSFGAQRLFHFRLRCYAGMIAARHPQGVISLHAPPADQNILQSIIHCMSHMQLSSNIRRRNHNAVRLLVWLCLRMKQSVLLPIRIPFFFK